ncbi:hypothetical protein [Bacillus cihuensis]|uniref:hypothetical protein n=1 Tax=Bacillus cihuensis TaxID=1208599 RepID=UPI0004293982|nr:hypothetical protein [Bacillus cihuensis]
MRVLLAVGEPNLADILRKFLVEASFDVSNNDILHRDYLKEIMEAEKPNILILHDTYLPSNSHSEDIKDLEMLQLIESWRITYNDKIRVVYLCERDRRDPFLGQLVARNVLDIFNERQISASSFVEQLNHPAQFANVQKFGVGEVTVEFEEIKEEQDKEQETEHSTLVKNALHNVSQQLSGHLKDFKNKRIEKKLKQTADKESKEKMEEAEAAVALVETHESEREPAETYEETPPIDEPGSRSSRNKQRIRMPSFNSEDILDLMPIPKEIYVQNRVVGTMVIGVAGVKPHIGATHIAQSIASYLSSTKHSVALVEWNESKDFDRIHSLYEGESQYINHVKAFELKGIEHYKYRNSMNLGEIFSKYEYVVLDIGELSDSFFIEEFLRAHLKFVITSPFEWKQHWLEEFRTSIPKTDGLTYLVPFANKESIRDLKNRFPSEEFKMFPAVPNPYELDTEADDAIEEFLDGYLKEQKTMFSKSMIVIASIASIAVTAIIAAFLF